MTNEEKILLLLEQQTVQLARIDNRLSNLETKVNNLESKVDNLESKVDNLETKVDNLETKVDNLEDAGAITRDGVNTLLQWAEECSETYNFPLPKVM